MFHFHGYMAVHRIENPAAVAGFEQISEQLFRIRMSNDGHPPRKQGFGIYDEPRRSNAGRGHDRVPGPMRDAAGKPAR